MTKIAVLLADGFEEMEALAPVDLLRRADFDVDIIGLKKNVTGAHGITVQADKHLEGYLTNYDLIIIPGGQPGATNLKENPRVIRSVKLHYARGKKIAAICAGPIVLDEAGILDDKEFVSFPRTEGEIKAGNRKADAITVTDGTVLTSRGAGAAYEFGFALIDWLGGDADEIKESTQYKHVIESYQ
jgi:4-methyl-5(b-hydroxyethyl)-thiazole monophosphate biosynthesis